MDVIHIVQDILQKTEEEVKSMAPVNILVAGKTGVGKSTLINAVFRENLAQTGIGKPVTKHLERITKEGIPLVLFDPRKSMQSGTASVQPVIVWSPLRRVFFGSFQKNCR